MLLEKFSKIIDQGLIGAAVSDRQKLINETDPRRIYVENIRSFFHIPRTVARGLLELGVRSGELEKRIGLLCPNCDRMLGDFAPGEEPEEIDCVVCKTNDEDESTFPVSKCQKIEFYRVRKEP